MIWERPSGNGSAQRRQGEERVAPREGAGAVLGRRKNGTVAGGNGAGTLPKDRLGTVRVACEEFETSGGGKGGGRSSPKRRKKANASWVGREWRGGGWGRRKKSASTNGRKTKREGEATERKVQKAKERAAKWGEEGRSRRREEDAARGRERALARAASCVSSARRVGGAEKKKERTSGRTRPKRTRPSAWGAAGRRALLRDADRGGWGGGGGRGRGRSGALASGGGGASARPGCRAEFARGPAPATGLATLPRAANCSSLSPPAPLVSSWRVLVLRLSRSVARAWWPRPRSSWFFWPPPPFCRWGRCVRARATRRRTLCRRCVCTAA